MTHLIQLSPADTELVFNLWAFVDQGTDLVYALAGRGYRLAGSDEQKLAVLKSLSLSDYHVVKRHPVPDRFQVAQGIQMKPGLAMVRLVGDEEAEIFSDVFRAVEADLPPLLLSGTEPGTFTPMKQSTHERPLCVKTVILEDDYGNAFTSVTN